MRNTLEDLYYGNITPGAQQIVPNSELKRATDRVTRFESQLTERLDGEGQMILAKLVESQHEINSITALENFILGFRLGPDWWPSAWMITTATSKQEVIDYGKEKSQR